jgi:hypothetical protein
VSEHSDRRRGSVGFACCCYRAACQCDRGDVVRVERGSGVHLPRIVAVRSSDTYHGDDWLGLRTGEASVARHRRVARIRRIDRAAAPRRRSRRHLDARRPLTRRLGTASATPITLLVLPPILSTRSSRGCAILSNRRQSLALIPRIPLISGSFGSLSRAITHSVGVIHPGERGVVRRSARQLVEGTARGVDLILELASGKRLVLVEERSVPRSGEQKHVPPCTCAA